MNGRDEKRLASELAGWLEGQGPAPTGDPTARAVARTAVMLVDALTPTHLHPVTKARLYERALAGAGTTPVPITFNDALDDPWGEFGRAAGQLPPWAWVAMGALATGAALGVVLLRWRLVESQQR